MRLRHRFCSILSCASPEQRVGTGPTGPRACLPLVLLLVVLAAPAWTQEPATDGAKPVAPDPKIEDVVAKLESFQTETIEQDGLTIIVHVVPDQWLLRMALAYQEGKRSGQDAASIEKDLRALDKIERKNRGRPVLRVSLDAMHGKKHFWLQKGIKSHVEVEYDSKQRVEIENLKGTTEFVDWKIYELNRQRDFSRKIAYFRQLSFDVTLRGKPKDDLKAPLKFTLLDILRYTEVEKRNAYERIGINTSVKQLALALWSELTYPPVTVTFYPTQWKLPELPAELRGILAAIDQ